ncbi:MAG: NADH:flavin oxidoreductase, partial [Ornithinimicrobium sp.]
MSDDSGARTSLGDPLRLPCGSVLKNRIAKAAMSDSLGDGRGDATEAQARLYARWARGGVGLSIIGEVQGDAQFPEKPGNLIVDASSDVGALGALAEAGSREGSALWAQLGHAGALADPALVTGRGPSALDIGDFHCDALSAEDIAALPGRFAETASRLQAAGFGGVEIHAAHGFLLSQFLSPLFNRRTDGYGGDVLARARLVVEVIDAVRRGVGPDFPIGIKLNASDGLEGGLSEDDSLAVV